MSAAAEHLADDAEHGERHDRVVRHGAQPATRVTLRVPGWRNWSDAPDLKSGGLRAMRVRVPPPASRSWSRCCTFAEELERRDADVARGARRRRAAAGARSRSCACTRLAVAGVPRDAAGGARRARGRRARRRRSARRAERRCARRSSCAERARKRSSGSQAERALRAARDDLHAAESGSRRRARRDAELERRGRGAPRRGRALERARASSCAAAACATCRAAPRRPRRRARVGLARPRRAAPRALGARARARRGRARGDRAAGERARRAADLRPPSRACASASPAPSRGFVLDCVGLGPLQASPLEQPLEWDTPLFLMARAQFEQALPYADVSHDGRRAARASPSAR